MKRKYFTRQEQQAKQVLDYLSRRDFLSWGIKTTSAFAIPGIVRTALQETSAYASIVNGGVPNYPVVQIVLPGGPLEFMVPKDKNGNALSGGALSVYGVKPTIMSESNRTLPASHPWSMGADWFNRAINQGTATEIPDFIGGLLSNTLSSNIDPTTNTATSFVNLPATNANNTGIDMSKVHAFNVAVSSQDDNGTDPNGCHNVLSAAGYKGVLADSVEVGSGMRNSPALSYNLNSFIAPTSTEIRGLASYASSIKETDYPRAGQLTSLLNTFTGSLQSLGDMQAKRMFGTLDGDMSKQLETSVSAAHTSNSNYTDPTKFSVGVNVSTDAHYTAVFGNVLRNNNAAVSIAGTQNGMGLALQTFATGLEAVLTGNINFLGWTFPAGLDYHGNNANNNDGSGTTERDGQIGKLIGAIINLAFFRQKNLIILVTKDGACAGNPDHTGAVVATGDRGNLASYMTFVVNAGNSSMNFSRIKTQIGVRKEDTGTADILATPISKNDMNAGSMLGAFVLYANGISPDDIRRIYPMFDSNEKLLSAMALKV